MVSFARLFIVLAVFVCFFRVILTYSNVIIIQISRNLRLTIIQDPGGKFRKIVRLHFNWIAFFRRRKNVNDTSGYSNFIKLLNSTFEEGKFILIPDFDSRRHFPEETFHFKRKFPFIRTIYHRNGKLPITIII